VDRLAKEATVEDGPVVYNKIRRDMIITQHKENGLHMCQHQWTNMGKREVTKVFFPSVRKRLRQKIPIFRVYNNGNRTWETMVIPSQIWTNR
jgi:hypothetical protein